MAKVNRFILTENVRRITYHSLKSDGLTKTFVPSFVYRRQLNDRILNDILVLYQLDIKFVLRYLENPICLRTIIKNEVERYSRVTRLSNTLYSAKESKMDTEIYKQQSEVGYGDLQAAKRGCNAPHPAPNKWFCAV